MGTVGHAALGNTDFMFGNWFEIYNRGWERGITTSICNRSPCSGHRADSVERPATMNLEVPSLVIPLPGK
ncbi:hypothetical protein L596_020433 [Steinernema carpocapsae]|uniref:Uncharacterized protein n=1 Tax=Steinernema carpocapsae TaxID=34508 RepID=A0A4U5MTL9_STECR|nr:hypothetical protein L596_020433 [Steinernema carpocapsae]